MSPGGAWKQNPPTSFLLAISSYMMYNVNMPTKEEITEFSIKIEDIARAKSVSYMDAIVLHCETTGLEIELAAKMISGALKAKIKIEAEELHFLPKSNTTKLPF